MPKPPLPCMQGSCGAVKPEPKDAAPSLVVRRWGLRRFHEFADGLFQSGRLAALAVAVLAPGLAAGPGAVFVLSRMPHWLAMRRLGFRFKLLKFVFRAREHTSGVPPMPPFPREELAVIPWENQAAKVNDIALLESAEECWVLRFRETCGDPSTPPSRGHPTVS